MVYVADAASGFTCSDEPFQPGGEERRVETMTLTPDFEAKVNEQITLEFEANMVYRQLAIEADKQDLTGFAKWLRAQADEEIEHANKFINHLLTRDGAPKIGAIAAPDVAENASPLELFTAALEHEKKVSQAIRDLYRAADAAGDIDSRPLLDWFINEQLEEEDTVSEIIGQLKLVGNDGSGLLRLDTSLGARTSDGTEDE